MASISKNLEIMAQVRRINKNLNAVVEQTSGDVEDTLFIQASLVASEQKANAPVDEESETPGALRKSVRVEKGASTSKKAVVVKIKAGGSATMKEGAGGKKYDYARAAAFGTVNMPKTFGFFEIWRARRKEVKAAVRKAVKTSVKRVFK